MNRATSEHAQLEQALARLPTVDLDPLAARMLGQAATRRLREGAKRSPTRLERCEPAILSGLAFVHLLWAVACVLSH